MTEEQTQTQNPMEQDYLEQIKELKEKSVSKEDYDKLLQENRKLLNSIVDGQMQEKEPEPEKVDVNQLRKDLFSEEQKLNNLQYWQAALKLRQAEIDAGNKDPFLPYGHQITPTTQDVERVENLVKVVQECIESAKGDSIAFTNELSRRTIEAMPRISANRR